MLTHSKTLEAPAFPLGKLCKASSEFQFGQGFVYSAWFKSGLQIPNGFSVPKGFPHLGKIYALCQSQGGFAPRCFAETDMLGALSCTQGRCHCLAQMWIFFFYKSAML